MLSRKIRSRSLSFVVALALFVGVMAWGPPQVQSTVIVAAALVEPVVDVEECATLCLHWELGCDSGKHLAILESSVGLNATWGSGPHYDYVCRTGQCDDEHPWCEQVEGELSMEQLRTALLGWDTATVAAAVAFDQSRYKINSSRSAIQVVNCTGDVLAHFPVPPTLVEQVQERAAVLAAEAATIEGH